MLGVGVEEMAGRPLTEFMDEESQRIAQEYLRRRRSGVRERTNSSSVARTAQRSGPRLRPALSTTPADVTRARWRWSTTSRFSEPGRGRYARARSAVGRSSAPSPISCSASTKAAASSTRQRPTRRDSHGLRRRSLARQWTSLRTLALGCRGRLRRRHDPCHHGEARGGARAADRRATAN